MAVGLVESLCLSPLALGHPQRLQTNPWGSELWTGVRPHRCLVQPYPTTATTTAAL